MKILLTGGHLTPALALIEYIQKYQPTQDLVFVGRRYAQESTGQLSREATEMKARGIQYFELTAVKLQESAWMKFVQTGPRFIKSLSQAREILLQTKPDVVITFGSYLAVPIALMAAANRIPVVTHEQTHSLGLANKIIAQVATTTLLSHPNPKFKATSPKIQVVGNFTRDELLHPNPDKPQWLDSKISKPLLLITGGSQGSVTINQACEPVVADLVKTWTVVHQLGPQSRVNRRTTPANVTGYYPREWLSAGELSWLLRHQPVILSRAGANTVHDLSLFDVTAILIPLPTARNQEQYKNAQAYLQQHPGTLLEQSQLSSTRLLQVLEQYQAATFPHQTTPPSIESPDPVSRRVFELIQKVAAHHAQS